MSIISCNNTKRYSWNFDETAERWCNDTFDTIEECLEDARKENALDGHQNEYAYIGENILFTPSVNIEGVLEDIYEQALNECGEVGHDWIAYDYKAIDELTELQVNMNVTLSLWLIKYGYYPCICSIQHVRRYDL